MTSTPGRSRVMAGGLLLSAVAAVVALDLGLVPLPFTTPRPARTGAAAAGVSPSPSVSLPPELVALQKRDDGVDATLERLSALLRGSEDPGPAVEGLVAPDGDDVRTALGRLARNVRAAGVDVDLARDRTTEITTTSDGGTRVRVQIGARLVEGEAPAFAYASAVLREAPSGWRISAWEPADDTDRVPALPFLFPVDEVAVRRPHSLVIGSAAHAPLVRRLADRVEAAAVSARTLFPDPAWDGNVVVYAMTEEAVLSTFFGAYSAGPSDPRPYAWWCWDPQFTARVALASGFLLDDSRRTRQDLRAAVADRAAMALSDREMPGWMRTGMDEYLSTRTGPRPDPSAALDDRGLYKATWRAFDRGTWTPRLPPDHQVSGTGAEIDATTDSAFLACLYIADHYGEKKLVAAWQAADSEPVLSAQAKEKAYFAALGTTRARFLVDLRRYAVRLVARS